VVLIVVVSTASRGGMVACAVALSVLLLSLDVKRMLYGFAVLYVLIPVAISFGSEAFTRQVNTFSSLETDYNVTSYTGRLALWKRGLQYIAERPVFGVGVKNFPVREALEKRRTEQFKRNSYTAHNAYIQAFAELGIPGGIIFLSLLGRSVIIGVRLRRKPWNLPEYLAGVLAFATAAVFLSHAFYFHLFALLGIMAHAEATLRASDRANASAKRSRRSRLLQSFGDGEISALPNPARTLG
jgi:O-antigen ligase